MLTPLQIVSVKTSITLAVAIFMAAANHPVHAQPASFTGLGFLPGLDFGSEAYDVSGDGSIVVGIVRNGFQQIQLFRWTRQTGLVSLFSNQYYFGRGTEISDDGSTIVSGTNPFNRWREGTGFAGGCSSCIWLAGLTSDGSTIVYDSSLRPNMSVIRDMTPDGKYFVGYKGPLAPANNSGYIWSAQDGVTVLGPTLPNGTIFYNPREISADGKVVVGFAHDPNISPPTRLAIWKKETGIVDLGDTGGHGAEPFAISGDGSVFTFYNLIWRENRGIEPLQNVLTNEFGLASQLAGWNSLRASGISNDGRTIVGWGRNPAGKTEGFITFLGSPVPEPSTLLLSALAFTPLVLRSRTGRGRRRTSFAAKSKAE